MVRGFLDANSTTETTATDYILGPAIYLSWSYGFLQFKFTSIFGLRDLSQHLLGLTFQDSQTISLGVRF